MSIYLKINMDVGLDGLLVLDPDTVVKSCIFYWGGKYNPLYPYNKRGFKEETDYKQIEICDIPVKEINWVIEELRNMEQ